MSVQWPPSDMVLCDLVRSRIRSLARFLPVFHSFLVWSPFFTFCSFFVINWTCTALVCLLPVVAFKRLETLNVGPWLGITRDKLVACFLVASVSCHLGTLTEEKIEIVCVMLSETAVTSSEASYLVFCHPRRVCAPCLSFIARYWSFFFSSSFFRALHGVLMKIQIFVPQTPFVSNACCCEPPFLLRCTEAFLSEVLAVMCSVD